MHAGVGWHTQSFRQNLRGGQMACATAPSGVSRARRWSSGVCHWVMATKDPRARDIVSSPSAVEANHPGGVGSLSKDKPGVVRALARDTPASGSRPGFSSEDGVNEVRDGRALARTNPSSDVGGGLDVQRRIVCVGVVVVVGSSPASTLALARGGAAAAPVGDIGAPSGVVGSGSAASASVARHERGCPDVMERWGTATAQT